VKPVYQKYVEPQREVADLIVPRGMQNKMAIAMIVNQIRRMLEDKSIKHNAELEKLGKQVEDEPFSPNIMFLESTPQIQGVSTILRNAATQKDDFVFYLDRLTALLVEKALDCHKFKQTMITTPQGGKYSGLESAGIVSAVVVLRGGSCLETGLRRTIPDCLVGRLLIQSNYRTAEPELHYLKLFPDIASHETVLLLDPQMSSGGSALMAVRILVDHGVAENKIVFVTCLAGKSGVKRLLSVYPDVKVVAANVVEDHEKRWVEERYFGC
jgi:uridine kinase